MKIAKFNGLFWAVALLAAAGSLNVACSAVVAPVNKSASLASAQENSGDANKIPPADEKPGPVTESTGEPVPVLKEAKNLGTFTDTKGDLNFKPVSGYGLRTESGMLKSFALMLTTSKVPEDSFKKITGWECKPCQGDNDSSCKTVTGESPAYLMVTFMKPFVPSATAAASAEGWPLKAESNFVLTPPEPSISANFQASASGAAAPGFGKVKFDKAPPGKVGDTFSVALTLDFGGKKFETTLASSVVTQGTPPAPPADCTLANKKYPVPIYEK